MPKIDLESGKPVVMSVGGSMIIPSSQPDVAFLKSLRRLVETVSQKLVVITGGGKVCRVYQDAASQVRDVSNEDLDWLGIHSTRFNAQLVKTVLGDLAGEEILIDPENAPASWEEKVLIGAGHKPGNSSDLAGCIIAKKTGASALINISNIDHVYSEDPNKNPNAEALNELTWAEYLNLIPSEWTPGLSTPFDPVASRYCQENALTVAVVGPDMENVQKLISGEEFVGTILK